MELLRLLFRNTLRHKLRALLTVTGVAIAVMAFALLRTVVTAWYAGVDASAANRLITRHAVSFVFPLPLAYRDRIARNPCDPITISERKREDERYRVSRDQPIRRRRIHSRIPSRDYRSQESKGHHGNCNTGHRQHRAEFMAQRISK